MTTGHMHTCMHACMESFSQFPDPRYWPAGDN